ncbi:MAG: hypothetical protein KDE31_35520, partial [Caldilineaceae bacterium]|nr:hypothetical protein [Caldilineaceae bacterium]
MFDLAQLYALLADQYGLRNMTLSPIHHVAQAGRGIFHVAVPGHADLLLRAYQQPRTLVPQLDNSAAVLCFL